MPTVGSRKTPHFMLDPRKNLPPASIARSTKATPLRIWPKASSACSAFTRAMIVATSVPSAKAASSAVQSGVAYSTSLPLPSSSVNVPEAAYEG